MQDLKAQLEKLDPEAPEALQDLKEKGVTQVFPDPPVEMDFQANVVCPDPLVLLENQERTVTKEKLVHQERKDSKAAKEYRVQEVLKDFKDCEVLQEQLEHLVSVVHQV